MFERPHTTSAYLFFRRRDATLWWKGSFWWIWWGLPGALKTPRDKCGCHRWSAVLDHAQNALLWREPASKDPIVNDRLQGPLSNPTSAVRPRLPEWLNLPQTRHSPERSKSLREIGERSFEMIDLGQRRGPRVAAPGAGFNYLTNRNVVGCSIQCERPGSLRAVSRVRTARPLTGW